MTNRFECISLFWSDLSYIWDTKYNYSLAFRNNLLQYIIGELGYNIT